MSPPPVPEPPRSPGAPPGWYPDPGGRRQLRWWTGGGWTSLTARVPHPVAPWARRTLPVAAGVAAGAAAASAVLTSLGRARPGAPAACSGRHSPLLGAGVALLLVAAAATTTGIGPVVRVLRGPGCRLRSLAVVAAVVVPALDAAALLACLVSALSYACLA